MFDMFLCIGLITCNLKTILTIFDIWRNQR